MLHDRIKHKYNQYFINEINKRLNWIQIQAGATQLLNHRVYSPAILQACCSFSIDGTISVNSKNEELIVIRDNKNNELFGFAIDGYGLFGTICDATLKINEHIN